MPLGVLIQSRFSYLFMHFESPFFLVLVFRVVLSFLVFWAIAQFVIQCHSFFSLVWRSKPFFFYIYSGIWCYHLSSLSASQAIVHFGIQSHRTYSFRHLESPSFCIFYIHSRLFLAVSFGVTVLAFMFTGTSQLTFMGLHLISFSSPRHPILIAYSSLPFQISLFTTLNILM